MGAEGGRQTLPTIAGEAMFRAVPGMAGDETGEKRQPGAGDRATVSLL